LKSGELLKYDWWFGDQLLGDEVNPTHCYELEDGTETMEYAVKLKVTTPFGCSDSLVGQDKITIYPNPLADFHLDNNLLSMLEPEVFITNYSEGGDSWLWNFGDSAFSSDRDPISHTYDVSGEYTIELVAISDFGCDNSVSRGVYVKPHQTLYVPSSFTPNSDGKNDLFEIKGEDLELVRLWVYDRWGNEVFFGENEDSSWDGTHSGKKMGMGVYSYVIEYKQSSRIKKRISGNVVISSIDN
jgi:gliding motility-associated-like protein